eukprot:355206-Chlamydomonas_euryale.AAC.1
MATAAPGGGGGGGGAADVRLGPIEELRNALWGDLVFPGEPAWAEATKVWSYPAEAAGGGDGAAPHGAAKKPAVVVRARGEGGGGGGGARKRGIVRHPHMQALCKHMFAYAYANSYARASRIPRNPDALPSQHVWDLRYWPVSPTIGRPCGQAWYDRRDRIGFS